jgi:formamidopyrimidine-DNA glycosylase
MTGMLRVRDDAGADDPYVRAWWRFEDRAVLEYRDVRRFGRIAVVPAGDHSVLPGLGHLGPEPFDPGFDGDVLWHALRRSRRRVKTQLLSQRPVAGVGNIYADEALWSAGIHPGRRYVTRAQAHRLRDEIVEILASAIDRGGTTFRDYRRPGGETGENQHSLRCYGRAGLPCLRCGAPLVARTYDARTATFCRTCQR